MAKINITVDIDWLDDVNFDDMLKDEILYGIRNYLKDKAVAEIQKKVDKEIAKVISDATGVIQKQVDNFIKQVTTDSLSTLKVAVNKNSWSEEVELVPINVFVAQRFEELCNKKKYDADFELTSYNPRYSLTELSIKEYFNKTLQDKMVDMIKNARQAAEEEIIKSMEQALKNNLAEETVKKMNIPQVLKNLQERYVAVGEKRK